MSDVTWIVEKKSTFVYAGITFNLDDALRELGIPVIVYDKNTYFTDEFFIPFVKGKKIYYGSTAMCRLAETHDPEGIFFDRELFQTSEWIKRRPDMLNHDAVIMTLGEARSWIKTNPGQWFVRPNDDFKAFSGMLMEHYELDDWMEALSHGKYNFDDSIEMVFACPKDILLEIRCFIVDGKVIDASTCRYCGRGYRQNIETTTILTENYRAEVIEKLNQMAKLWTPHKIVTMDVTVIEEASDTFDYWVTEFNCFNGTGFYDNNVQRILKAVTDYVSRT